MTSFQKPSDVGAFFVFRQPKSRQDTHVRFPKFTQLRSQLRCLVSLFAPQHLGRILVPQWRLGPLVTEVQQLSLKKKGRMLSISFFAGAFMHFPLNQMAQYIVRRDATLIRRGSDGLMKVAFARKLSDLSTHATQPENLYHLYEKDGRLFSLIHAVSFCGFVDLIVCPTRYVYAQYEASKVQAGQLNMLAAFLGAALRVMGGWLSDLFFAWVNTLTGMLVVAATYLLLCGFEPGSVQVAVLLFLVCSSALVVGNCALFKLVPMRWRARSLVNLVRLWGWCPT